MKLREKYHLSGIILFGFLFLPSIWLDAQNHLPKVYSQSSNEDLQYPWAGGLNSVQFGAIDLNLDGTLDLLALDRDGVNNHSFEATGNRKYSFINHGIEDSISYSYEPQYAERIPELFNWAIFKDYNADGRVDIFTYSPGWSSMIVYKNVSESNLKFELVVYPYLSSLQNETQVNILVTYVDYPGIEDIDFDGDLDILCFWGLGSFVEMHKNMSMELYGHADSLVYEKTESCWGFFAESDESNHIYLDSCHASHTTNTLMNQTITQRHTGSTFQLLDLDADMDMDLLLGDVDYPGLFALMNGGDSELAYMETYDTIFPTPDENIDLFSMPVTAYVDVNNDDIKDLLVSPFDPDIEKSENKNSVWLYINEGQNYAPLFKLNTTSFLQDQMIDQGSGAYPVIYDWDGDGLDDLIIGNYGFYQYSWYEGSILHSQYRSRVDFYKNTGTIEAASFQLWERNLGSLMQQNYLGLSPTVGDIDGDGQAEIMIGNQYGKIILLEKSGNSSLEVADSNYMDIDVGDFSTPQLYDVDHDGLLDLVIGERSGNINYYHNEGNAQNPVFTFITDSLGKVNVTDLSISYDGFSTPSFFKETDGKTGLLVGSEQGKVFYFTQIDDNLDGVFMESDQLHQLLDTLPMNFDMGLRTSAIITDLNHDGQLEMMTGNYAGGLEFFNASPEVSPGWSESTDQSISLHIYPNPGHGSVKVMSQLRGEVSLQLFDSFGKVVQQKQLSFTNGFCVLDISHIPSGIYYLQLNGIDQMASGKLIVR